MNDNVFHKKRKAISPHLFNVRLSPGRYPVAIISPYQGHNNENAKPAVTWIYPADAGAFRRFRTDRSGSTAMIFGLAAIPIFLTIGAAVDYSKAAMMRSHLQAAADAAVLAVGAKPNLSKSQREALAANIVNANLGSYAKGLTVNVTETEPASGVYQVQARTSVPTSVMSLAQVPTIAVSARSQAQTIGASSDHPIEIALALDNTGSMQNDMAALKAAAKSLVQTVMGYGVNGAVKLSVVPYVAAVNPGFSDNSMVDTAAQSPWTGDWMRWAWIAYNAPCSQNWGSGGGGGAGSGGSGDAGDLIEILNPFRRIARELFGVSAAHAADVTANTISPLTINNWKSPARNKTYKVPAGFGAVKKGAGYTTGTCEWLTNPGTVSHYELFNRVLDTKGNSVAWKGCVEARPTKAELTWMNTNWGTSYTAKDYDVTEEAPSAGDPRSLFVPYFAPDEPDWSTSAWGAPVAPGAYVPANHGFHNNYLSDGAIPSSGTAPSATNWGWTLNAGNWIGPNILKYDKTTKAAIIQETGGGRTYGPNAGCPDPVLRLTKNQGQAISKIEGLNYWDNGGTIISEGLMWAWRTLSPNAPYADGKAYNTTGLKKVIVLMTDGVNELNDNDNNAVSQWTGNLSEYTAYGYMGANRLYWTNNVQNYAAATTFLDNRLLQACANAKAAGVKIYTVLFSANLTAAEKTSSEALLKQCASDPTYAFSASDATGLSNAFGSVASSAVASPLRLTGWTE